MFFLTAFLHLILAPDAVEALGANAMFEVFMSFVQHMCNIVCKFTECLPKIFDALLTGSSVLAI